MFVKVLSIGGLDMFTLSQGILMLGDGMSLVFGMVDRAIFFLFEVFESG